MRALSLATMLTIGAATALPAAAAGDAAEGLALARQWCAACHLVEAGGSTTEGAPPFAAVADRPGVTADSLRAWLAHPHPPMPDLALTRAEIEALVAYIASLGRD